MKYFVLRMAALFALGIPVIAHAVTLGEARVNSYLNQPLDVEIAVVGLEPGQHEQLRLRIANQDQFDRLGISYDRFLAELDFTVIQSAGRWVVRVRSQRPVSEPFLDFPLQMNWPGGQMIRQYTLLLDPPTRVRPAQTTRTARTAPATAPAPRSQAPAEPDATVYGPVQRGETLWPIAQKLKPRGITTRQMAMALLRANPQAFIDGNVNNLRAGSTLSIPPRGFIEQMDAATARTEFAAQTRRWQAPIATSPRPVEGTPPAPGATAAAPEDSPRATAETETAQDTDAQLRIVTDKDKSAAETGGDQDLQEQLLVTMEEIESNRITTTAIETRLARLEGEIDRMQKLVELKDAQIAALQSEVSAREAIERAAQVSEPAPPAPAVADTGSPVDLPAPAAQPSPPPAAVEPAPPMAPPAVARIEPVTTGADARNWYEQFVWVPWALAALLALTTLILLFRRPPAMAAGPATAADGEPAHLPPVDHGAHTAFRAQSTPAPEALRRAEEDLRDAAESVPEEQDSVDLKDLPELSISPPQGGERPTAEVTDADLDAMLDQTRHLAENPLPPDHDLDISDEDIASWAAELGNEGERADTRSANDEQLPMDDDIPSILTELDDQLMSAKDAEQSAGKPRFAPLDDIDSDDPDLASLGNITEDDTFAMSLDLARAYLEIGDQEGAKDMLKQALSGARDPDHRRQIEELLQQID